MSARHALVAAIVISLIAGTLSLTTTAQQPAAPPPQPAPTKLEKIDEPALPNALRIHPRVISGGLPDGDEGFAALERLGVKTVISVDGAVPDVATAEKYGLRYVHLPHGYDGIPDQRGLEISRAVRDLPGPIYIHCHHGRHRSPAAAAVACVELGLIPSDEAPLVLQTAGTSDRYQGLFKAALTARQVDQKKLDAASAEFPKTVKPAPMVAAMGAIEHTSDHLRKFAATGWKPLPDHPDLTAAHEALLLKEHFTELARTDDATQRGAEFLQLLDEAIKHSADLEEALIDKTSTVADSPASKTAARLLDRINRNCTACHAAHRDK